MKKLSTLAAGLIAMLCSTTNTFAQVTVTANATATIVTPISITKTADMNFGNVAVQSSTAGTVVLATDNSRTQTGGVTLPATTGTVSAAIFTVNGESAYTYTVTLPSSLTISNSSINMTINAFSSTPSGTGTLSSGSQTLKVGATLNVAAAQAAGTYTSTTPFNVTVNYN
ncbi:DUF4402 domain-containing protein [Chitinophaga oryziterrae]|uniref:DUF4402 domain-containing protein n=1 Tax=Chitinophaga oryziterrae TaxID=1031224 RepID=A0A6N8JCF3_9BACT|nr:DUF4402 domain-containing protein [Chitinophaga oryziterrae]MVT41939.1 DUF4402 domain-containing protein [Chitinophaga oryziterrae]